MIDKISGRIDNVIDQNEVDFWSYTLQRCDKITVKGNDCYGIDENHLLYTWFLKNVFTKLQTIIDDSECKLVFGMFLNETSPWGIHTDADHTNSFSNRLPGYSLLIPISVNNDKSLVSKSHTVIFNQYGMHNKQILNSPGDNKNNAVRHHSSLLSHNDINLLESFSLNKICQWKAGSLIYWKSEYFHDSDNFIANGYFSKQAIVVHTYYDA